MSGPSELRRGDVIRVNLDPVVGREIGKTRPAVIVQNDVGNRFSPTIIVAAITRYSKEKVRFPFCVPVSAGDGGLSSASIVNASQIRTIDGKRSAGPPLGRLAAESMERVDMALRVSLELGG